MNEFMWGALTGAVVTPFAWLGIKWCYGKFQSLLAKS